MADDVRSLAQRGSEAAGDIRALIAGAMEKISSGNEHVLRAGSATEEVMAAARCLSDVVRTIGEDAGHQRQGIGHATDAIAELDRMARPNVALAERSAAAAGSLEQPARRLTELVARFRLEEEIVEASE